MFSVSPSELVTIALIALLVFGPKRLPEITRKIGRLGRELSKAANELKSGIEKELEDTRAPLDQVRRNLGATVTPPPAEDQDEPDDETRSDP